MKASDYIAHFLRERGVTHVFELVGGMITHMVDSLNREEGIELISMHHEQGAAFAAEGFSRCRGLPAVAMATSGPGATNLLTGIGSCYFDSVPMVFITGQVNTYEQKGNAGVRQSGFQETDILSMAKPITKAAWSVDDALMLPSLLTKAFSLSCSGRPGPVLLDIPMDVQRQDLDILPTLPPSQINAAEGSIPDSFYRDLAAAKRPVIIAGGGIRSSNTHALFEAFVELSGIPVVTSLLGLDALPYDHPQRIGFFGSYGNRWSNLALGESDFVLVLGSRLDIRQTGADTKTFETGRKLYHVDVDADEINYRLNTAIPIHMDLKRFFDTLIPTFKAEIPHGIHGEEWLHKIEILKKAWPDSEEYQNVSGINPHLFLKSLSEASAEAAAYAIDVGQHQMWSAQSLRLKPGQRFLTSGGMGAMGFALPAGIGASLATGSPVVVIAGDGGFQLNIQELETLRRRGLPVKIVVINNQCHGMVRQFQESYFDSKYQSTLWGYSCPDFEAIARAYNINSNTISKAEEIESACKMMWEFPHQSYLLQVNIATEGNVYPKIAFGKPFTEMEPFAKPIDMEGT